MSLTQRAGRALAWNAGSFIVARAVSLVRFVILARLLEPEDFGLLAIAWAAIEVLLVVTDTGASAALVQRRNVEEKDYDTAWTLRLLRTVLVAGILFASAPLIADLYDDSRATPVLQALAVAPVLSAAASIKTAALTRRMEVRRLGALRLTEVVGEAVVSVVLAAALGVWALVIGVLAANVLRLLLSYVLAPHRPRLVIDRASARSLLRFGRWMFITGVFLMAGDALLRMVVARQLGTADLGAFYLALRLALLPLSAVEAAVGAVGMRAHAELGTDDHARRARAFQNSLVGLLVLLAPVYAILAVLADPVVQALGPQWRSAAGPLRVLSVMAILGVIGVASAPMVTGMDKPQLLAAITGVRMMLLCATGVLFTSAWGLTGAATAYLFAEAVTACLWWRTARCLIDRGIRDLWPQMLTISMMCGVATVTAGGLDRVLDGPLGLVACGVGAMGTAIVVLVVLAMRVPTGLPEVFLSMFPRTGTPLGRFVQARARYSRQP